MEDKKLGGKYSWRVGGYNYKADANLVGHEIEQLDFKTPENIVEYARDKDTELHKVFEWDDSVASELYRKNQATTMLNNLVYIVRENIGSPAKEVKAFVNTKRNEEYKTIEYVLNSPTEYSRMLEKATNRLKAVRNQYSELIELKEIYDLIDKL